MNLDVVLYYTIKIKLNTFNQFFFTRINFFACNICVKLIFLLRFVIVLWVPSRMFPFGTKGIFSYFYKLSHNKTD